MIRSEHPVHLPDGSTRTFREVQVTVKDGNGIYRTDEIRELEPCLDCGCQPDDEGDIYQCYRCLAVVDGTHMFTCGICGRVCCTGCWEEIEVENSDGRTETLQVCVDCAWQEEHGFLAFLEALFFGD